MTTDKFKDRYRAPLDHVLRESSIRSRLLSEDYCYPLGDVLDREHDIQEYFSEIAIPIRQLYGDVFELPGLKNICFAYRYYLCDLFEVISSFVVLVPSDSKLPSSKTSEEEVISLSYLPSLPALSKCTHSLS